ncbi:MAG TPA: twin-arginine translocase TatA/TatE family subunit [Longimicrobiales bacterium]|nr:twin-arginine translocase TatA/TatE family subunit [Longimicrobiales bacterium]
MFGNIGPGEMVFILLVLLLVFGAKRLPEIGSSLGRGIREFKRSMTDIQQEINRPDASAQVAQAPRPQPAQTVDPAPAAPAQLPTQSADTPQS